jgi:elongation factor G
MTLTTTYRPEDIRNIALVGPKGVGKTTLAEALLLRTGAIHRMGSVNEATTVGDFEPEARSHHHSTASTLLFGIWEGKEVNIIDTPGHPELVGQALAALGAVETAVLVIDAVQGVEDHARRLFQAAGELGLARMVVVNRIDLTVANLPSLVDALKSELGGALHCLNLPTRSGSDVIDCFDHEAGQADFGNVAEVHRELLEASIEVDDAEVERYFAGERIDPTGLRRCFVKAMTEGHVVPVLFTAGRGGVGVADLLHVLAAEGPSPTHARPRRLLRGGEVVEIACDATAPLLAHVFKVTTDPQAGRLAMLRILQGTLDASMTYVAASDKKPRRVGHVLKLEGRERPELGGAAYAGDLVALAKVEELHVDQVIHAPTLVEDYAPLRPRYPPPALALALEALDKKDKGKLGAALAQLVEEDPTLALEEDPKTHAHVLRGLGELHLGLVIERLRSRFGIEVKRRSVAA